MGKIIIFIFWLFVTLAFWGIYWLFVNFPDFMLADSQIPI